MYLVCHPSRRAQSTRGRVWQTRYTPNCYDMNGLYPGHVTRPGFDWLHLNYGTRAFHLPYGMVEHRNHQFPHSTTPEVSLSNFFGSITNCHQVNVQVFTGTVWLGTWALEEVITSHMPWYNYIPCHVTWHRICPTVSAVDVSHDQDTTVLYPIVHGNWAAN